MPRYYYSCITTHVHCVVRVYWTWALSTMDMSRTSPARYASCLQFTSFSPLTASLHLRSLMDAQWPLSGTFSYDQRCVYEGVLAAQRVVLEHMTPGTLWSDCHRYAEIEIIKALLGMGVLKNGTVEQIVATNMGAVFFPHGLGHLIGCDTHDVGG